MPELDMKIPQKSATLRHLVEDKIRSAIAAGVFAPGQRLVERELGEMTGVGRTSIREALRQLEAEGLIVSHPHRGPSVAKIELEEARQLYAVRSLLESFAGSQFALKGSDEQVQELGIAAKQFAEQAEIFLADSSVDNRNKLLEIKTNFYRCLMEGSQNVIVSQFLSQLHNRITLLRATSMTQPGRLRNSVEEINSIVSAIRSRDSNRTTNACRYHIDRAAEVAISYLERVEQST